jgi:hypothetical protein
MKINKIIHFIKQEWFKISIILLILCYMLITQIIRPISERRKFDVCMEKYSEPLFNDDFDKKALDYCIKESKI